jgi:hypothetical protein
MKSKSQRFELQRRVTAAIFCAVLAFLCLSPLAASAQQIAAGKSAASQPIEKGQRFFIVGHSFHVFIADPLRKLAEEAGIKGHTLVGRDMIGNSTPMQHWEKGGDDNAIKQALRAGGIDVLSLSPNRQMPEPAIDMFGDLAAKNSSTIRVLVQQSWSAWDGNNRAEFTNEDHNKMTLEGLARVRQGAEAYAARMRAQLKGINDRHGREVAFLVPASQAVTRLREEVIKGKVPGITKQSELFRDAMGHAAAPLAYLVDYCWFAAMYRRSPVGLTSLDTVGDEKSKALHKLLQEIALEAVLNEPMSGFKLPEKSAGKTAGKSL